MTAHSSNMNIIFVSKLMEDMGQCENPDKNLEAGLSALLVKDKSIDFGLHLGG